MQLEGIAGDDALAMSRVEYTGESKKTEVEYMDVHFIDTGLKKFYRNRRMYLEDPISYLSATYGGPINYSGDPEELKNKLGYDFQEIDF